MLHEILIANRLELIDRCKAKVLLRPARAAIEMRLKHGIPQFLDLLIQTLRAEQQPDSRNSERLSGVSGGASPGRSEMGESAALHGRELFLHGFTVDEVVHDYGDLCQAVTELAAERGLEIEVNGFHTLNRCLDNAIAEAVKEYAYGSRVVAEGKAADLKERHGFFVHELRNHLNTATLAFAVLRAGRVTAGGATGDVLDRSLKGLVQLIERSVTEVRQGAVSDGRNCLISLSDFIADSHRASALEADARKVSFVVSEVDPSLAINVDRDLVFGALSNLLTNAFKFTHRGTEVTLNAYAAADRVLITVSDNCGGIPAGGQARMFVPFGQSSPDRSGLGLGLSISRKNVEGSHGDLTVRNVPGKGCVFTIDLPRHLLQPVAALN